MNSPFVLEKTALAERRRPWTRLLVFALLVLAPGSRSSRVSARLGSNLDGSQERASGIATQLVARGFASDIEHALRKYHPEIPHGEHRQLAEQLASTFFDDEELKSYENEDYEKGRFVLWSSIYQDGLSGDWQNWSYGLDKVDLNYPEDRHFKFECSSSIFVKFNPFAVFNLHRLESTRLFPKGSILRFYIKLLTSFPVIEASSSPLPGRSGLDPKSILYFSLRNSTTSLEDSKLVALESLTKDQIEVGHWIKVDVPIDDYVDYSSSPVPSQWNEILLVGSKYARNIELLIDDIGVFDSEQNHNNMPKLPEFIESSTAKTGSEAEGEEQGHGWCEYLDTAAGRSSSSTPICKVDGDHLAGEWQRNCNPELIQRPDHYAYHRSIPTVSGFYSYRVCFRLGIEELWRSRIALTYTWRTQSCIMEPFDADYFNKWLGTRKIFFLGDSITGQHYSSFLNLMSSHVVSRSEMDNDRPMCMMSGVGDEGGNNGQANLSGGGEMMRVMQHHEIFEDFHNSSLGIDPWWAKYVREADIVLMNVGHHYSGIDPRFSKYNQMALDGAKGLVRMAKPTTQFIFRTTNVGHWNCSIQLEPMKNSEQAIDKLSEADKYNWRQPGLHEHVWEDAFEEAGAGSRFRFLNVSFIDARADAHVGNAMFYSDSEWQRGWGHAFSPNTGLDCLHYCFPGPMDFWSLSLYNLLIQNLEPAS